MTRHTKNNDALRRVGEIKFSAKFLHVALRASGGRWR